MHQDALAAAKTDAGQIDKQHYYRKQNAKSIGQAIDTHPRRFLFLLHRQRRIFFFFGKTKKKKMGG